MSVYTAILLYEYTVLTYLAINWIQAVASKGIDADMTSIAFNVFHTQELLLAMVTGALVGKIIHDVSGTNEVGVWNRVLGGLGDFILPYDGSSFLKKPEQRRPRMLQQVSETLLYFSLM